MSGFHLNRRHFLDFQAVPLSQPAFRKLLLQSSPQTSPCMVYLLSAN
jgi:hypothetical protein